MLRISYGMKRAAGKDEGPVTAFSKTWVEVGQKRAPCCPLDMVSKYLSVRKQQLLGDDHHQQKPCLTSLELPK